MQFQIGIIEFAVVSAYIVLFGFFWRTAQARLADTPFGKAMAFVF